MTSAAGNAHGAGLQPEQRDGVDDPIDLDAATRTSTPAPAPPAQVDSPANHVGEIAPARLPAPLQYRDPARYDILGEHGRGGLGRVFRARDREMGRDVAVKELLNRGASSELRFFREALITARLEHPGIVPVHEAGRWPDGTPFYAMKLVAGRPLKVLFENATTVEARLALLPNIIAVADAIAYAHDRKIIHRDLKPANVIVGEYGETVVIDWGLAKDISPEAEGDDPTEDGPYRTAAPTPGVTVVGSVLGTPAYMAPEQARGELVDERADVYAIGAMLFQVCTGEKTPPTDVYKLHHTLGRSGVDVDLVSIVRKACAPEAGGRYRDAGKLAADLRAFAAGARVLARHYSAGALVSHWVKRHRKLATAVAVMIATVAVVGVVAFVRVQEERDRARAARDSAVLARENERASRTVAEVARDTAILSEVAMLRATDPTRALERLNQASAMHPSLQSARVLLQSRTIGTGTATAVFSFAPALVLDISMSPDWKQVALRTTARKLHIVEFEPRRSDIVAERLLDPSPIFNAGGAWHYFPNTPGAPALATVGRPNIPLTPLHGRPLQAIAVEDTAYVLDASNTLHAVTTNGPLAIAERIGKIVAWDSHDALLCTLDGQLHSLREQRRSLGPCAPTGGPYSIAAAGDSYAAVSDSHHMIVAHGKDSKRIAIDLGMQSQVTVSHTGLVAAISENGHTWYVPPGAIDAVSEPLKDSPATYAVVDGMTIAWGYADGSLKVLDASSGNRWTFFGHQGPITRLAIKEAARIVISTGGSDMRVWALDEGLVEKRMPMPCASFNVEPNSTGDAAAVDCHDGATFLVRPFGHRATSLHRHRSLSFSPAWLGSQICSGGWDGQVICSDTSTHGERTVASYNKPVRWLESSPFRDRIAFAVDDGSIWLYDGKAISRLYEHQEEPYRIAFRADGLQLASGDQGGELATIDLRTNRVEKTHLHQDLIFGLEWSGSGLRTTSFDGTLRLWSNELRPLDTREFSEPLRELKTVNDALLVSRGNVLSVVQRDSEYEFDLGARIADIDASADGRYAAVAVASEVIVLRLTDLAIASVTRFKVEVSCARFVNSDVIALCVPDALLWLRPTTLTFVSLPSHTTRKLGNTQ